MIRLKIRTLLGGTKVFDGEELEFSFKDEATIKEFLKEMKKCWGDELASEFFESNSSFLVPHMMLMINGRNIKLSKGEKTILQNGDEVLILPVVGGG